MIAAQAERRRPFSNASATLWDILQAVVGGNSGKKRLLNLVISQPCRIIEIGCATGNIASLFNRSDYTGVDTNPASIESAKRKYRSDSHIFLCIDFTRGELPSHSFDYVLLSHTLHHLPNEMVERFCAEAARILRPGGQLVILDMERPSRSEPLIRRLYHRLDRGQYFRTKDEAVALVSECSTLRVNRAEIHPTWKWRVRIIDQFLIAASKAPN